MQGRKKEPLGLLKLKGTYRKDRHGEDDAETFDFVTTSDIPMPPEELSKDAVRTWNITMMQMSKVEGWVAKTDLIAFENFCTIHAECKRLKCVWMGSPYKEIVYDDKGNARANPTYQMWLKVFDKLLVLIREFGLTPTARRNINTNPVESIEEDPYKI